MNQNEAQAPQSVTEGTAVATDSEMLTDLVLDLEAITGMVERTRAAVAKGKTEVRLIPRSKPVAIAAALDELGDILTRRTLQVRAQRAQRDGTTDEVLEAALDAANGE